MANRIEWAHASDSFILYTPAEVAMEADDGNPDGDGNSHSYADRHGDADADVQSDRYGDRHPDPDADEHADGDPATRRERARAALSVSAS